MAGKMEPTKELYALRPVAGKGLGLVATRNTKVGDCILEEEPLLIFESHEQFGWPIFFGLVAVFLLPALTYPSWSICFTSLVLCAIAWPASSHLEGVFSILYSVYSMPLEKRKAYYNLYSGPTTIFDFYMKCTVIYRRNSLAGLNKAGMICAIACRVNHSCTPNVTQTFHADKGKILFHAQRPISAGEEITHCYTNKIEPYSNRYLQLTSVYLFECDCVACHLPEAERCKSDERRTLCAQLFQSVREKYTLGQLEEALEDIARVVETIDREFGKTDAMKCRVCWNAYQINTQLGRTKDAKEWAQEAYQLGCVTKGKTHPQVVEMKAVIVKLK